VSRLNKNTGDDYFAVTPQISALTELCRSHSTIDPQLYAQYDVKRGLRDINGKGVLAGLTEISEIVASKTVDGKSVPCEGELYYRGVNIKDLVNGFVSENRFGFEETVYLLLFGSLPSAAQLADFRGLLIRYRTLPTNFVRDIIMKAPSFDMMNTLARSVLTLYAYDEKANDPSLENVLRQCVEMIALFPQLAVYGYQAYRHNLDPQNSFFIHAPRAELSTAENILYMLRIDNRYTPLEARILDLALVLHAEHGGGNNSSFTTHVVASSGTDAYSVIAAALGSLKGPKHGGANVKVVRMFEDMKREVGDWSDEAEVADYLHRLLNRQAFDRAGLIYGMGHAVYSLSDPRADLFRQYVQRLSAEKGLTKEYELYALVERLAPEIIGRERKTYKGVSANIDFYSGFVYHMLGLPTELFTPVFAMARIAGWSAHLMEEKISEGKIIRPAYMSVAPHRAYLPLSERGAAE
jgi:citrate synthase